MEISEDTVAKMQSEGGECVLTDNVVLSSLLDRESYLPGLWDLSRDGEAKAYWIRTLKRNLQHMVDVYSREASPKDRKRCKEAQTEYLEYLAEFESNPTPDSPRTVNALVEVRQDVFEKHGIPDPYKSLKDTENTAALAALDALDLPVPGEKPLPDGLRWAFSMIMAGNFFDMGSAEAREEHTGVSKALVGRALQITAKRWFRDDLQQLTSYLERGPRGNGTVVICIDNAGAEIVLGVTHLIRELASVGFAFTLVANESAALNDMTATETIELLRMAGNFEPEMASLAEASRLEVISSGSRTSGIDMTRVSTAFNESVGRAEVLIVIGQGRAIETNWKTRLSIPWARAAVVKDKLVARAVGCEVFDPLLTFETTD